MKKVNVTYRQLAKCFVSLQLGGSTTEANLRLDNEELNDCERSPYTTRCLNVSNIEKDARNEAIKELKKLSSIEILALRVAYCYASCVPYQDREDCLHEFYIALCDRFSKAKGKVGIMEANSICKSDWINFLQKRKRRQAYFGGYLSQFDNSEAITRSNSPLEYDDMKLEEAMATAKLTKGNKTQLRKMKSNYEASKAGYKESRQGKRYLDLMEGIVEFETETIARLDAQRIYAKLPPEIQEIVKKRLKSEKTTATERKKMSRFCHSEAGQQIKAIMLAT